MSLPFRTEGTYTALVTPFHDDASQSVNWEALDALVDHQIAGRVSGLVPCGTTGESPALSPSEQMDVVRRVVHRAEGRVQVIAGTGTSSTHHTIERCKEVERAGVHGLMVVCPYYSRPSQDGLLQHFAAVAASVSCAIVIYNIPGRTGVDLLPETLERICQRAANVVAVKEATGNVTRTQALVRRFGDRLTILSGDDALTLPIIAVGGRGVISVVSNLLPKEVVRATSLALENKLEEARRAHLALLPVYEAMFLEANPAPVKAALSMDGKMSDVVRSPLVAASEATRIALRAALEQFRRGDA
jgi:4-hydroxy-tetrahydrodipicolinate synthase